MTYATKTNSCYQQIDMRWSLDVYFICGEKGWFAEEMGGNKSKPRHLESIPERVYKIEVKTILFSIGSVLEMVYKIEVKTILSASRL